MKPISIQFDGKTVSDGGKQRNVIEVGEKKDLTLQYDESLPWKDNEAEISLSCPDNITLFYTDSGGNEKVYDPQSEEDYGV